MADLLVVWLIGPAVLLALGLGTGSLAAVALARRWDAVDAVTVPLNTLGDIEFAPGLSALKQQAAAAGQATHGAKVWVQVRGDLPEPLVAVAPDDRLLNYMHTEVVLDDGQILVGFGNDASVLDVTDPNAVAGPVRDLLGDVEIVAVGGHDWLADRFSRGTWCILRPGQLTDGMVEALQAREGRAHFAGDATADGWNGFHRWGHRVRSPRSARGNGEHGSSQHRQRCLVYTHAPTSARARPRAACPMDIP